MQLRDFFKALPGAVGVPVVIGAVSVGPDDAASNLSKWAHWLGIHRLPGWLIDHAADRWAIMGALLFAVVYPCLVWGVPYLSRKWRQSQQTEPILADIHRSTSVHYNRLGNAKRPARCGGHAQQPPLNDGKKALSHIAELELLFEIDKKTNLLWLKYLPDNPEKRAFDTMLALLFGYKEILARDEVRKSVMRDSLQKSRLKKPLGSEFLLSIASGPLDFYDPDEIYSDGQEGYKYDNDQYIEKGALSKGGAFKLTDAGYERARAIVQDLIDRG